MLRQIRSLPLLASRVFTVPPPGFRNDLVAKQFLPCSTIRRRYGKRHTVGDLSKSKTIIQSPIQDCDIPESPFLAHYLMENWHKFPNKIALINADNDSKITYGQLHTYIIKVGSALSRLGFGKGDTVTIFSFNCPEFCLFYLAATSIGMTVSSVNPQYTQGELEHALNNSETTLLIFSPALTEIVNASLPNCPTVKRSIAMGSASGHQSLADILEDDGKAFPENVSYNSKEDTVALPYSSGTSGPPKGVMLTSYSLVANIVQISNSDILNTQHDDVYLCVLPLFHIYAQTLVMFTGLRFGCSIVTMAKFDKMAYLENVQKYKPTTLHIVPPIMLFLTTTPLLDKYDTSSVERCLFGAAPAPVAVIEQLQHKLGKKTSLCQAYGMTELSPVTHCNPISKLKPDTVGVAIPNTKFKIRDIETNVLLPAYKEGELCVKGPQLMNGYYKNEQATRETIIDGWLHTGDVAYYDNDGYTVITDRIKELIKVKGFQVAPAELEGILLSHPSVQDAAVIGKPDDLAGELPRAYVVLKPHVKATAEDIASYVKGKVAPYKQLKGGVEFRKEIPKSASGKILRRILRKELQQASN